MPIFISDIWTWIGIGAEYVVASAMIAGGVYLSAFFNLAATNPLFWLLRPLRYVGYALIGVGIALAAVTYGKTLGAASCEAAWKRKNLEAEIGRLKQEAKAKEDAAALAASQAKELARQKQDADEQIAEYQTSTGRLETALAACRRATADDDRRLCAITGSSAAGCQHP
jgi:hypothetical protein